MSIAEIDLYKLYLEDEQERLSKIEDDDFLKQLLTRRCESYERIIKELTPEKELEDEQQRPTVLC